MSSLYIVLIMICVGALIGGFTNSIAIKMLFRPYRALYIGSFRVPFTPGLIPKRRQELAEQLGKLVVTHLLTVEGMKQKLESSVFIFEMREWLTREVVKRLKSEVTINSKLNEWLGISNGKEKVEKEVERWISVKGEEIRQQLRPYCMKDIIPKRLDEKIEEYIPEVAAVFLEKGKMYFNSEEGIEKLSVMVDRFLIGKGTFGNMISMFISRDQLITKLQPELLKMLSDKGTYEMVEMFIQQEWQKIKELKMEEVEEKVNMIELIAFFQEKIKQQLPFDYLDLPLYQWTSPYEQPIIQLIPRIVEKITEALSSELAPLLKKLQLEEVVKNQVEQFPVKRLEDMILSISRREFKLITFLGALLGGLIGLLQGILMIFIS